MSAVILAIFIGLSGCGSLMNGTQQQVRISTIPPRAKLTIDGEEKRSPVMMVFDRTEDHHIVAEMEGFEKEEMHIESVPSQTPLIANCLLLLCIPQLFESERITHYELVPAEVDMNLNPIGWSPR